MAKRKILHSVLSLIMAVSIIMGSSVQSFAKSNSAPAQVGAVMQISSTDGTKIPHYFGPYPNWANSPFKLPDAVVEIAGDGFDAAAVATVGANGAITGIQITNPGYGYTTATITIKGSGKDATADAVITSTGIVTKIKVDKMGGGYTQPVVTISNGGGAGATAEAFGGVDNVTLTAAGSGYLMPTVDFDMPDDPNGMQAKAHAVCVEANCAPAVQGDTVTITGIVVDNAGSGYSKAPGVVIRDGTIFSPLNSRALTAASGVRAQAKNNGIVSPNQINVQATSAAAASATINVQEIKLVNYGSGFTQAPTVDIADVAGGAGSNALASASTNAGGVTGIKNLVSGSGYFATGGIKKFQDGLPVLCDPRAGWDSCTSNNLGQHIPIAVPDTYTFSDANNHGPDADYYVIGVIQHREQMNSDLQNGTLLREYVQLRTSAPEVASVSKNNGEGVLLYNDLPNGSREAAMMPDGITQAVGVDDPHFLGPIIVAKKDRPVRIVFYNLLPTGAKGDLFLPVDTTMMGAGEGNMAMDYDPSPTTGGSVVDAVRNPMCTEKYNDPMMRPHCVPENRATLHLHGGITPWISDGTVHQWITPAAEETNWPQGVDVQPVPDMNFADVPSCAGASDGCMTFYYTNQQSARLMFYHDHSWGITRLNVYAGEAAGYEITDATEQKLITDKIIPSDQLPLIIQDRTFVPSAAQLAAQDPTWDSTRWGGEDNLWYHHVYMPAQNPSDPSGMSAYGRWMYGPWFWPPSNDTKYGPIANPYYDSTCKLDDPTTWQYDTDPFCEPELIPGTPNISVGMEQFNDTPIVNGTAYPTTTVEPKAYRLRLLNAANDRFWNLQWYVADPRTASTDMNNLALPEVIGGTEVALNPAELAAAQTDPNVFPTPDTTWSPVGPNWIQIGNESGFLAAPAVIPNQPITWITDPTRFDFGNVDQHALLLAPAERADVIVDFSKYAGQTLILYNDAPAAFPARVASYDYYTGAPDLSPVGAPGILPGYGPNTRTIMQVKVSALQKDNSAPASAYNLTALQNAFKHHANGSGVFEAGQNPIIVGQAAYNSAYGTNFATSSWCNAPSGAVTACDGFARIQEQGGDLFGFNTLLGQNTKMQIPLQPKTLHDEMNASTFDEFGRMQANLGVESVPANPGGQNINLMPFVFPQTEVIDGTLLPRASADVNVTPISSAADGTQIWKFTHNGVDTHPIHFHLFDVQVLNRVTWDNIVIQPDANELGWKDTVRISPLEDTIVALRPVIPKVPFDVPNAIRQLDPSKPDGAPIMLATVLTALKVGIPPSGPNGQPIDVYNHLVNFGWEYVYHCHILSHEEMDMMRPVSLALPPVPPDGLVARITSVKGNKGTVQLTWNDRSISETSFAIERQTNGGAWTPIATIDSPLNAPNTIGQRSYSDTTIDPSNTYQYRVLALNTVGDTTTYANSGFPTVTAKSPYSNIATAVIVPAAPTNLKAALQSGPNVSLSWTDNATNETGFVIERAMNGGAFTQIATPPLLANTGSVTFVDSTVTLGNTYAYRVAASGVNGASAYSNTVTILVDVPAAPTNLAAFPIARSTGERMTVSWTDNASNETGFTIQWSTSSGFTSTAGSANVGANATTYVTGTIARQAWYFRIRANNVLGSSNWVTTAQIQPANIVKSPLIFLNDFTLGLTDWTGHVGNVQTSASADLSKDGKSGLSASWDVSGSEAGHGTGQPAYVFHEIPNALGSFMVNFEFNPNGAVTSSTPISIFTGLDATGVEIFGIEYRHAAGTPGVYEIRGWAKTGTAEIYTDWAPITNAAHEIQLDWQSDQDSSLNLYVDEDEVASVEGDTSLYQLAEERLGPSRGVDSLNLSALAPMGNSAETLYFDQYVSLSTEIADPFTPSLPTTIYLPILMK